MTAAFSVADSGPSGNCNPRIAAALSIALDYFLSHPEPDDTRHARIEATLAAAGFRVTNSRNGRRIEARDDRAA